MILHSQKALVQDELFAVIPSLDLLRGEVVRLTRGDFATAQTYGSPDDVLQRWNVRDGSRLHIVDLEGSRTGRPIETAIVRELARRDLRIQVGGGIRTGDDAKRWIDCGAQKVVTGTALADEPESFARIVDAIGPHNVIAAIDLRDRQVRVAGWERKSSRSLEQLFAILEDLGVGEALVTDISVDGTMLGPAFDLYRDLSELTNVRLIASGGVGIRSDVRALAGISGVSGAVIGRALHEGRFTLRELDAEVDRRGIPNRIIPCLDVRNGRVVKGVRFESLRDAGDPVEAAQRYEAEGADEIVVLDVSATMEERRASLETIGRISENLFIPLTVGGGVRSVDDFRTLLQNGADRVGINTAAVQNPQLIADCAREFGVQAVVLAVDARRHGGRAYSPSPSPDTAHESQFAREQMGGRAISPPSSYEVVVRSGTSSTPLDAVEWCRRAEELGAGEILLTSIDRDGTADGYDVELLRAVTSSVNIGVIASGGAGQLSHFAEAIERGGASAVLAASLFHDRKLSVREVKQYLNERNIDVRMSS